MSTRDEWPYKLEVQSVLQKFSLAINIDVEVCLFMACAAHNVVMLEILNHDINIWWKNSVSLWQGLSAMCTQCIIRHGGKRVRVLKKLAQTLWLRLQVLEMNSTM